MNDEREIEIATPSMVQTTTHDRPGSLLKNIHEIAFTHLNGITISTVIFLLFGHLETIVYNEMRKIFDACNLQFGYNNFLPSTST